MGRSIRRNVLGVGLAIALAGGILGGPTRAGAVGPNRSGFITSRDGQTQIHFSLFLPPGASATNQVPVIFRTHGWGGRGETNVDLAGSSTSAKFINAGYALMTWDQRGFGTSGGEAQINHPDYEVKDVKALIDYVADPSINPEILLDGAGDPRMGMSGGSYAGGIQLVTAAHDKRVDAIAPEIAWNHLPQSLFPNGVPKLVWDTALYGVGMTSVTGGLPSQTGNYAPEIHQSYATTTVTNDPDPWNGWFDARSNRHWVGNITAPAFIMQGTVDTLFTINQGLANFLAIRKNAPAKIMLYNTGHTLGTVTAASGDSRARADAAMLNWFAKYLKGLPVSASDPVVDPAVPIVYMDQFATWRTSSVWPVAASRGFYAEAYNLVTGPAPTGGGAAGSGNPNRSELSQRFNLLTAKGGDKLIVGIPRVTGVASGTGTGGFLFFKLVNTSTNQVLDDQVTPLRVVFNGLNPKVKFDIDMEGVSYLLKKGETLALEIATGGGQFSGYRGAGLVHLKFTVRVPLA